MRVRSLALAAAVARGAVAEFDVFDYVDPLIGTLNGGNVCDPHSEELCRLTGNRGPS